MQNRISIVVIIGVVFQFSALAQIGTQSPYSISGLGEIKFSGLTQHVAAGGTSRSNTDAFSFSPLNPASYGNTKYTTYVAGASARLGRLTSGTTSTNTRSGNFDYFGMALPFSSKRPMSMAFGLYQYSQVGYSITNRVNTAVPSYYNLYRGSGGLTRLFVGYGAEVAKNLTLGVNYNYNFGNVNAVSAKVFPNTTNYFSYSDESYNNYRGSDFDFGLQYTAVDTVRIKADTAKNRKARKIVINHTFGATYHTQADLKGTGFRYSETFFGPDFDQGQLIPIDTILYQPDLVTSNQKPSGFGVGYTVSNGEKWAVSLEMEQYNWSGLTNNVNSLTFFDQTKYAAGINIIPEADYTLTGNYLKKIRYSAGYRMHNMYYNFTGDQIKETGISFGLGLPVVKYYRPVEGGSKIPIVSRINIVGEYMQRGTPDNGLIQEDYFTIGIGLNFNDKWFQKNKYR